MLILKYFLLLALLNSVPVVLSQDGEQIHEQQQEEINQEQEQVLELAQELQEQIHEHQAEQTPEVLAHEETQQQNPELFHEEPVLIRADEEIPHFGDEEQIHDADHLKLHLEGEIDTNAQWDAELETFQYFRITDVNEDHFIDGLEIIKAVVHDHNPPQGLSAHSVFSETALENLVDRVLQMVDANGDGLIDFAEFSIKKYQEHLSHGRANS